MSATIVEAPEALAPLVPRGRGAQPLRPRRVRVRPAGRSGRSLAPRSRPTHPVEAPSLRSPAARVTSDSSVPLSSVSSVASPVSIS